MGDGVGGDAPPLASKNLSPPLEQKIRDLQKNLGQKLISKHLKMYSCDWSTFSIIFHFYLNDYLVEKLLRLLAFIVKLQPLNFLTLSNDQNPAKPRHRPFEKSLFLFNVVNAAGL